MHELGRYLQSEIDRRGWTIAELARRASISRQTLYSLINDNRDLMDQTPQRKTVNAIADALGVNPIEILTASAKALGVPVETQPLSDNLDHLSDQQILLELATRLSRSKGQNNESTSTGTPKPPRLRAVAPAGYLGPGQKTGPDDSIIEFHGAEAEKYPAPPIEQLAAHPGIETEREKFERLRGVSGEENQDQSKDSSND